MAASPSSFSVKKRAPEAPALKLIRVKLIRVKSSLFCCWCRLGAAFPGVTRCSPRKNAHTGPFVQHIESQVTRYFQVQEEAVVCLIPGFTPTHQAKGKLAMAAVPQVGASWPSRASQPHRLGGVHCPLGTLQAKAGVSCHLLCAKRARDQKPSFLRSQCWPLCSFCPPRWRA